MNIVDLIAFLSPGEVVQFLAWAQIEVTWVKFCPGFVKGHTVVAQLIFTTKMITFNVKSCCCSSYSLSCPHRLYIQSMIVSYATELRRAVVSLVQLFNLQSWSAEILCIYPDIKRLVLNYWKDTRCEPRDTLTSLGFVEWILRANCTESRSALFPPSLKGVFCLILFEMLRERGISKHVVLLHVLVMMKSTLIIRTVSVYVQPCEPVVGPPLLQPAEPLSAAKNGVESASVYNMATRLLSFLFHRHLTNL